MSALAGRAAFDADQRDIGLNDPLVATNRGWLGALTWRYTAGPRVTWTQRVGVTGGEFSNRSLARVVLDEGRSTDISARSDSVFAVRPHSLSKPAASAHWQDEQVTKRRVVNPARPPDLREDAALESRWAGGYALARWTLPRGAIVGAGARVDHWDGTGETTASPWVNAQVRIGPVDVVGGTGLFHQFPGFNAISGLRGTPGLPAERAWHADVGVGRRIGAHLRAQAVWFHRDERDGLRLPGDEWQMVDGRPRPPLTDTAYDARLDGSARVSSCCATAQPERAVGVGQLRVGPLSAARRHDRRALQRRLRPAARGQPYGVYRINDRTSVAMKLRASSNFPVRGYFEELPPRPDHPVPEDQPARTGCPRRATAHGCPSTSASTCGPTARGRCSAAG